MCGMLSQTKIYDQDDLDQDLANDLHIYNDLDQDLDRDII